MRQYLARLVFAKGRDDGNIRVDRMRDVYRDRGRYVVEFFDDDDSAVVHRRRRYVVGRGIDDETRIGGARRLTDQRAPVAGGTAVRAL